MNDMPIIIFYICKRKDPAELSREMTAVPEFKLIHLLGELILGTITAAFLRYSVFSAR